LKKLAAFAALALGAAACGDLDNVTTVKDLRVLGVRCEPAGFLVDLANPGGATDAMLSAKLTALVVDPLAPDGMVQVSAVGCPDYIDAISSATLQGSKLCPPPGTPVPIPELASTAIMPADSPFPPIEMGSFQYEPALMFGLTSAQIGAFFMPGTTGIPAVDQSIALNRDYGLAAIVNLNFDLEGEHAEAIKRVVYWPKLEDAQLPNQNPTLRPIRLFRARDMTTGDPDPATEIDLTMEPEPTVSISAMSKLYVQPDFDRGETYLLRVHNNQTDTVETKTIDHELLRFYFYATAGTFTPAFQFSELNLGQTGPLHTDAEYKLPKPEDRPADGKVTIWIVASDERAGTSWVSTRITVDP
jgi:hypothetical protein